MSSPDHFEAIVGAHYESLYRFAFSLTRSVADAQDLTQHTFLTWASKGHQLRDISKVKTWLFTTLHRAFLLTHKRQSQFVHENLDEALDQLPASSADVFYQTDSSAVLLALSQVAEVYRAAVALFYLEGWSYKEIAATLGVPAGTVKSRIARGLLQLKAILLSDADKKEPEERPSECFNPHSMPRPSLARA